MAAVSQKEKDMIERRNREWDEARRRKKQTSKSQSIARRSENELEICERGIDDALNSVASSFRVLGKYVKRVLDGQLWKKGDYSGFEDWCDRKYGWTRQRGYQLAEGRAIIESLPAELSTTVDNERQARALAVVKPSSRPAVINRAVKSGEPLTGNRITRAIKPSERKKKTPVIIDVTPEPKPAIKNSITLDIAECLVCETETLCLIEGKVRYCEPCIVSAFESGKAGM